MWSKAWLEWFWVMFCFIKNETGKGGGGIGKKLLRCEEDRGHGGYLRSFSLDSCAISSTHYGWAENN